MTLVRFFTYNFFLKSKNIEKRYTGIRESKQLFQIIWTVGFCLATPNIFLEDEKYTFQLFDLETGTFKINTEI